MEGSDPAKPAPVRVETGRVVRLLVITGVVVAVVYALADRLVEDVLKWESAFGQGVEIVVMAVVTSSLLWYGVLRPLLGQVAEERQASQSRQRQIEASARQQQFESQLHRALEMVGTETSAYAVTGKALRAALDGQDAELLMADSSDAHLTRVLNLIDGGSADCSVVSPHDCPAVRRSQTLVFPNSEAVDACPHLDGRPGGPLSAVCVPMSVGGRSIGVLHTTGAPGHPPPSPIVGRVESVATQAGSRIGMLRVMSATTLQAATDPLTGLLNRRSFEERVRDMTRRDQPFALAMGDLDHFKGLNDTHGHEAGDRALRMFARTTVRVLRSEDLVCRFGGEEFAIVFPNRSAAEAVGALERLQQELLLAFSAGTVPGFTASFGVAHSDDAQSFEELYRIADGALFRAKRNGRDQIVCDVASANVED